MSNTSPAQTVPSTLDVSLASSLVYPTSPQSFLSEFWTSRFLHSDLAADQMRALIQEHLSDDVEELLGASAGLVRAWFFDRDLHDTNSLSVSPAVAYSLYRAGLTLYFELNRHVPFVRDLRKAVSSLIDRSEDLILVSVFTSREGNHTPVHVDHRENFTIQLAGRKLWTFGPPSKPGSGAEDRYTVGMVPGAMLYVPGEWWHEVRATTDSVSLNISVGTRSWASMVIPELESVLAKNERWRMDASGILKDGQARDDAARELRALISQLAHDLQDDDSVIRQRLESIGTHKRLV